MNATTQNGARKSGRSTKRSRSSAHQQRLAARAVEIASKKNRYSLAEAVRLLHDELAEARRETWKWAPLLYALRPLLKKEGRRDALRKAMARETRRRATANSSASKQQQDEFLNLLEP